MQEGSFKAFHNVKPALQEMLQAALRCLNPRDLARGEKRDVSATVRVKCTVTERGRIINLKQVCVLTTLPIWIKVQYDFYAVASRPTTNHYAWQAEPVTSCQDPLPRTPARSSLARPPWSGLTWPCVHKVGCSAQNTLPTWGWQRQHRGGKSP